MHLTRVERSLYRHFGSARRPIIMKRINSLSDAAELARGHDVVSFDIFDTLLRRKEMQLAQVHDLASRWLLPYVPRHIMGDAGAVMFYRQHTCNILRDSVGLGSREPALDVILERLLLGKGVVGGVAEAGQLARRAVEFELALEATTLEAHPEAGRTLARLKRSGKKVIALSDMYFRREDIEAILDRLGLLPHFDRVFVSSDIGWTKHEGDAFGHVAKALGAKPSRIMHIGDNDHSDGAMAHAAGWSAAIVGGHFPPVQSKPLLTGRESVADIAGDIMASFLVSTLLAARDRKVRKVFFLSRDAAVFQRLWTRAKAANAALAELFKEVETSELCVSRASTHWLSMPWSRGFADEIAGRIAWLHGRPISYEELCHHLDLKPPPMAGRIDRAQPPHQLAARLVADGFVEKVRAEALRRRQLAVRYLEQEGVIGAGRVMMADIGYSGTIAVYVNNYLLRESAAQTGSTEIFVHMVASNAYVQQNRTFANQTASIEDGTLFIRDHLPTILADNFSWLEALFKDVTRGPLLGYREEGGRIFPVFEPAQPADDAAWRRFEDAAFAKLAGGLEALALGSAQAIDDIRARAIRLFHRPEKSFVDAIGELTQETDALGLRTHGIVEAVSPAQVIARMRAWKVEDFWISGCLVASGQAGLIDRYDQIKAGNTRLRQVRELPKKIGGLARRAVGKAIGR